MARPYRTTIGTARPTGAYDPKVGRGRLQGLEFSRIPGVRRIRGFPAAPRDVPVLPEAVDYIEAKYQEWYTSWGGTRPEFIVFDYLVNKKKYVHGIDFAFQSSYLGGRQRLGGSVVDFEVYRDQVFIRVQGERFHLGPENLARDTIQAVSLLRTGYKVVDVWAEQVAAAPYTVIEAALRGQSLRAANQVSLPTGR